MISQGIEQLWCNSAIAVECLMHLSRMHQHHVVKANTYCKPIGLDACQGNPSQEAGITFSTPSFRESIQDEQGFVGGGGITWPEYRAAHMDLPLQEALRRFRAIKRGQNPNTITGGMHI